MALNIPDHDKKRLFKLDAIVQSNAAKAEKEKAEHDMHKLFKTHGYSYSKHLRELRAEIEAAAVIEQREREMRAGVKAAPKTKGKKADALSLVYQLLKEYVDVPEHEHVSLALWILHSHVCNHYQHTPRLVITSPTPECGKTNTFKCVRLLAFNPETSMSITTAQLSRDMDTGGTVIIDEAEHIFGDHGRVDIIKGGFDKYATKRIHKDTFQLFGPMALGGVDRVPGAIASRALNIHIFRSNEDFEILRPDDPDMRAPFYQAEALIATWVEKGHLNLNPEMPEGMKGRYRDKWLPLISIADSFGPAWGKRARASALATIDDNSDQVIQAKLLLDFETIFNDRGVRYVRKADALADLLAMDGNYQWAEYRGPKDDADTAQRKLREGDISRLLWLFRIATKKHRVPKLHDGKPLWYYDRADFERHWPAYKKYGTKEPVKPKTALLVDDFADLM